MPKNFEINKEYVEHIPYLYVLHELCQFDDDIRQIVQDAPPYQFFGSFWVTIADLRDAWHPELLLDESKMQDIYYVSAFVHAILHKRLSAWIDGCLQKNNAPYSRLDLPAVASPNLWNRWLTTTIHGHYFFPNIRFSQITKNERNASRLEMVAMLAPAAGAIYFGFSEVALPLGGLGLVLSNKITKHLKSKDIVMDPNIQKLFQSKLEWHEVMSSQTAIGRLIRCALVHSSYDYLVNDRLNHVCLLNVKPHDVLYISQNHQVLQFFGLREKSKLHDVKEYISYLEDKLYPTL